MCCLYCSLEYLYSWSFILEFEPPSVVEANAEPPSLVFWLSRDALPSCFLFNEVVSRLLWFLMSLFQVVCTSSRFFLNLYVPHPGCFFINPGSFWNVLPGCFWFIRVLSDLVLVLSAPLPGCLHFVQVLSELVCTSSGLFSDQSGFFLNLSCYLQHLFGVVSDQSGFFLVLISVPNLSGLFFFNPGSFWSCPGSCRTLSGFFFDQSGFFLILS